MPTLNEALANNLERILREKNLSQTDLAKMIKTSFQTVNNYMHARGGISSKTISTIAAALKVEETDLTSGPKLTTKDYQAFYELTVAANDLRSNYDKYKDIFPESLMHKLSKIGKEDQAKLVKMFEDRVDSILNNTGSRKESG